MLKRSRLQSLALAGTLSLLAACSPTETDVHDLPRETQAWENVDSSSFDQARLIAQLDLLVGESIAAAAAGRTVEFHHLEVALSEVLRNLKDKLAAQPEALAEIAALQDLAHQLHAAGHDGHAKIGQKIAQSLSVKAEALKTTL